MAENQDQEGIKGRLAVLAQHGQFVRSSGLVEWPDGTVAAGYGFIHDLYREVLYDRVPPTRKRRWHLQIGDRKEIGYGAQAGEIAAELAGHFVHGRDPCRAVQYLQYAGEHALQPSAPQEVVTHPTQAMALLAQWPETQERAQRELRLQTALGPASMVTKGFGHPEVGLAYAWARALCQQVGNTSHLLAGFLALLAEVYGKADRPAEGLAALDEALELVKSTGAWLSVDEFHGLRGDLLWQAGHRPEDIEACFRQALTIARGQQAKSRELRATLRLSRWWQHQGKLDEGLPGAGGGLPLVSRGL